MLHKLAAVIPRGWPITIAVWLAAFVLLGQIAPDWESVVSQGEFEFLPDDVSSRVAQRKLEEAFPDADYGSSLIFLVEKESGVLQEDDLEFIDRHLIPLAEDVAKQHGEDFIVGTLSPALPIAGDLLRSKSGTATIVLVQLKPEFLHEEIWSFVNDLQPRVEQLTDSEKTPPELNVYLSGSAVLGRDITKYRSQSAEWIQRYAGWLVVGLLLLVFRAPVIALIPLVTMYAAVQIAMVLLSLMAQAGWITLFDGVDVYLTVIAYGAGVDYSLFLVSRYQEELKRQVKVSSAITNAVENTGTAIVASGCTEILGIFMLVFAAYGKLSQAGVAISFSLTIMLLASVTLTPALLRAGQRWAFWPVRPLYRAGRDNELDLTIVDRFWQRAGLFVVARPWKLLLGSVAILAIPATVGLFKLNNLSYGLISELPKDSTSAASLRALQRHFPSGTLAPMTALIGNRQVDFNTAEAEKLLNEWTQNLMAREDELHLADIQNFAEPLGVNQAPPEIGLSPMLQAVQSEVASFQAASYFISQTGSSPGHVTRAYVTLTIDPFSRSAIASLDQLEQALFQELPRELRQDATLYISGPTASVRSMQHVAERDQIQLFSLVTITVFALLALLLRKWLIAAFMVASVGLTFCVTIAVTWWVFWFWLGDHYFGIDWSVPLLLFTLLMAVGADYNVLLVSRCEEEVKQLGLRRGIVEALRATGAVITGCGVVMAGTFATLLIGGELHSLKQLGFSLAFAMLFDTFIVRTFLVPSFLMLWGRKLTTADGDKPAGTENPAENNAIPYCP